MSKLKRLPKGAYLLAKALAVTSDADGNITVFALREGWWESQVIFWPDEVRKLRGWLSRQRCHCELAR